MEVYFMNSLEEQQSEVWEQIRQRGSSRKDAQKKDLEGMYLRQHLTMAEIGKIYGVTRQRVCQLIKQYEIDTRQAERFKANCDKCGKEYTIYRKRYRKSSTHYCSSRCYLSDRTNTDYRPHRNGQREARRVMAKHIGRPLTTGEIVHHIDGNCSNNSMDNLILFPNHKAHMRWHHSLRINQYTNIDK